MAGVICPACETMNPDGQSECIVCNCELTAAPSPQPSTPPPSPPPRGGPTPPVTAPAACPTCAAPVPDPSNLVCVHCLEDLVPTAAPAPVASVAGRLRLRFPELAVDVPGTGVVLLGRDAGQSPVGAALARRDNVSRRHASVGTGTDGVAFVRDEYSVNGTFVNDRRVPPGAAVPLAAGDVVRLASDVVVRVEPALADGSP